MTSLMLEEQVLKVDGRGRVRTPVERREALLDEFERSGLSAAKFAALAGIKYQTFGHWVTKRRKRTGLGSKVMVSEAVAGNGVHWMEALVARPTQEDPGVVTVQLPGGARMKVADTRQAVIAAQLLRALEAGTEARRC